MMARERRIMAAGPDLPQCDRPRRALARRGL